MVSLPCLHAPWFVCRTQKLRLVARFSSAPSRNTNTKINIGSVVLPRPPSYEIRRKVLFILFLAIFLLVEAALRLLCQKVLARMASSQSLSTQASTNYKEAFSLFDKRGTGRVSLDSLGDLLRACGQNPTLAEIRDLEKQAGGDCKNNPTSHTSATHY